MACSSECVASSIVADQDTLEQIRQDEFDFYGGDCSGDEEQPSGPSTYLR